MDKQLYILGAGRHPRTKLLRAQKGHQRRTFYIGEIHVQSGKRLPISIEWASMHFDTIVKHIKDGTVLLHFGYDKFVDPEELRVLCFGTPEENEKYAEALRRAAGSSATVEPQAQPVATQPEAEVTVDSPTATEANSEPVAAQESQGPTAEELENVAERSTESVVDLDDEPAAELTTEPEAPLTEEQEPEVVPEAPVATEEPEAPTEPEPETTAEEPRVDATPEMVPPSEDAAPAVAAEQHVELPEDWRRKSKTTLLGYAQALGLDVSSMPSNKQLIAMIEEAKGS
jgi:hypothetical protein